MLEQRTRIPQTHAAGRLRLYVEGTGYASAEGGDSPRHVEVQQGSQAQADMGVSLQGDNGDSIYGRLIGTNLSTQGRPFDSPGTSSAAARTVR